MFNALRSQAPASTRSALPELADSLLARCAAGDPVAFRAFVERYQASVFALLSRLVGRGDHVEDLAQDTFLRAFRGLSSFEPNGSARVSTWLLTISTRLALDFRRRNVTAQALVRDVVQIAQISSGPSSPEHDSVRLELALAIRKAADELPDDQRAAFVLSEFHDFTQAEVANALGVPEGTIKTRLFRARQKLAGVLSLYKDELE